MFDTFGNKVKINDSPQTQEMTCGKIGEVYGQTTPSKMDVEIIGTPKENFAVNVYFDDIKTDFWFDVELLEIIDDGQGTVITLAGVNKKWTKGKMDSGLRKIHQQIKLPNRNGVNFGNR